VNWISGEPAPGPTRLQVKIRYKALEAWGMVQTQDDGCARVLFDQPQRGVTPGQAVVFYDSEVCLGGGITKEM
jgi:tRNA-specific 2-thiouridylase